MAIKKSLDDVITDVMTFVKVSPIQQVICAGMSGPVAIFCAYTAIEHYSNGNIGLGIMQTTAGLINVGCVIMNEKFASGNLSQYREVKRALEENGWDERLIDTKSYSWCQRNLVLVASYDTGFGKETKKYLKDQGYRWYSFLR